ncbi:MAG: hypothetical protein Q8N84_00305 [bacterium]|nr:hypothetical protein [bacterium]
MGSGVHLRFEAEAGEYSGDWKKSGRVEGASACYFLDTLIKESFVGEVVLEFTLTQGGDFWVWGRAAGVCYHNDSFLVAIDPDTEADFLPWAIPCHSEGFVWEWSSVCWSESGCDQPNVFHLAAGNHRLVIKPRESLARLDALEITNQSSDLYKPGWRETCP